MKGIPAQSVPGEIEAEQAALATPAVADSPAVAIPSFAPTPRGWLRRFARAGMILLLGGLLYLALHKAPLHEIWEALAVLRASQVAVLLGVDACIYALISARWWFIVHAERPSTRYLPMIGVRLAVFAVSYFTFGPQVGGEPLQILYLRRNYSLSYTRAAASVVMDKLLELLANFLLISFGLLAALQSGILAWGSGISRLAVLFLLLLMAWPLMHIMLLYNHVYPIAVLLRVRSRRRTQTKALRFVTATERLAGQFCQRHPKAMLSGILASLLAAAATVSEYALIASFLRIGLPFWQLVTAWTSGWLSFLVPLPGGLGALEASQVLVLGFFGVSAAAAISLTLILRGRDLVIGGLGLLLAGHAARRF